MYPEDFEIGIPTVHIETDSFTADVIEMYEMPSKRVMPLMSLTGPEQMEEMLAVFKLAIVNPAKVAELDSLSFGEMSGILTQWYMGSIVRMRKRAVELEVELEDLDDLVVDIKSLLSRVEEEPADAPVSEVKTSKLKTNFKITQGDDGSIEIIRLDGPASNDPGDGISPFDL